MDIDLYKELYETEKIGWWDTSRRNLIMNRIKLISNFKEKPYILDFGCGTGGMLEELQEFSVAYGCDKEDIAIEFCGKRGLTNIVKIRDKTIPFKDNYFDIVIALDVLEHIEDDFFNICELNRVLRHKGFLLITVPAFMLLWTTRDKRLHHFRRYNKKPLANKLKDAGFIIRKCTYMHFFYFIPLLIIYKLKYLINRKNKVSDIKTNYSKVPRLINSFLIKILNFESFLMKYINFPFGVSIFCIAQKS
jgi:SAM-dependent methyltransferase